MSILFSDIYAKAIGLFDDPKITRAYETNILQYDKIMYTYLQNAIAMFNNPLAVSIRLSAYNEPKGVMEVFESDGENNVFELGFDIIPNSVYCYIETDTPVKGEIDPVAKTVTFPDVIPAGQQYAVEQYYVGEFTDDFSGLTKGNTGNQAVINYVKDILARLLVKAWGESLRNELLDINGIMTDSDFKITGSDKLLRSKNEWIDQLDFEITQLTTKLGWSLRFMQGSSTIGRG